VRWYFLAPLHSGEQSPVSSPPLSCCTVHKILPQAPSAGAGGGLVSLTSPCHSRPPEFFAFRCEPYPFRVVVSGRLFRAPKASALVLFRCSHAPPVVLSEISEARGSLFSYRRGSMLAFGRLLNRTDYHSVRIASPGFFDFLPIGG